MQRHFGTDGIRGRAGESLNPELAVRAAYGFTRTVGRTKLKYQREGRPLIYAGCDPRLSSPMLKAAVCSGIALGGCDVIDVGIVPTPLIPFMVLSDKAAGGVMITASHNPVEDNGIKFFNADGVKINAQDERRIEEVITSPGRLKISREIAYGEFHYQDPTADYLAFVRQALRLRPNGNGFKIVLDCAHGATCQLAPAAFKRAGFKVDIIHGEFDGHNVNVRCGATDLNDLSAAVAGSKANMGLAFDGDGDRVLAVDESGRPVSGDKIIALFSTRLKRYREAGAVVMTHMTNVGVENALAGSGVRMVRTEVGDSNVLRAMVRRRLNLGGEQSGHIIMRDKLPGGDGILVGLQLASLVRTARNPLSRLIAGFTEYPQILTNLKVKDKLSWQDDQSFERRMKKLQARYADARFYLRPSGTEDVVRVLTEACDPEICSASNEAACGLFTAWDRK